MSAVLFYCLGSTFRSALSLVQRLTSVRFTEIISMLKNKKKRNILSFFVFCFFFCRKRVAKYILDVTKHVFMLFFFCFACFSALAMHHAFLTLRSDTVFHRDFIGIILLSVLMFIRADNE